MSNNELMPKIYSDDTQRIRPAARHILTVGKGIIKDNYTAVVELVKNAYDAEASQVSVRMFFEYPQILSEIAIKQLFELLPNITSKEIDKILQLKSKTELFNYYSKSTFGNGASFESVFKIWQQSKQRFKITVEDDGHGMPVNIVIGKWLVPSTDNKALNPISKNGKRTMQGKKGIGRYAASILGEDLLMSTVDEDTKQQTIVYIDWWLFESGQYQYLDEVPILIETFEAPNQKGTKLEINAYRRWTNEEIDELVRELKKLLSPLDYEAGDFKITLFFENFDYKEQKSKIVEPYPLLETYHYRIKGNVVKSEADNKIWADFTFENDYDSQSIKETIKKEIKLPMHTAYCGEINFDIRVFDLDSEGIENIASRLHDLKEVELRRLLQESAGIAIFREKFRIRPYGDKKFDWLSLNERRVNNPTLRLGTNQVTGIVYIQDEQTSGLEEKATREGLKETPEYEALKAILIDVIAELEPRKLAYRRDTLKGGREKPVISPQEQMKQTADLSALTTSIETELKASGVDSQVILKITEKIKKTEEEKQRNILIVNTQLAKQEESVKEIIAVYQVQATLGKIITVLLHEGRKPLAYLREQPTNVVYDIKKLKKEFEKRVLVTDDLILGLIEKITIRMEKMKEQSEIFIKLFSKLDSLAITKRSLKKEFDLVKVIAQSFEIFEAELNQHSILPMIDCPPTMLFKGWDTDFIALFTNLIENSIYWLAASNQLHKKITVKAKLLKNRKIEIDFIDNGVGIEAKNIQNLLIFEPGFSTKANGTGLGLAIAGEAAQRNGGVLKAIYNPSGAHFKIELNS